MTNRFKRPPNGWAVLITCITTCAVLLTLHLTYVKDVRASVMNSLESVQEDCPALRAPGTNIFVLDEVESRTTVLEVEFVNLKTGQDEIKRDLKEILRQLR